MSWLFRTMIQEDEHPAVGCKEDMLGVRPGLDIQVANGQVEPRMGGLSASSSLLSLPPTRLSVVHGGNSPHPTWKVDPDGFPASLVVRQHGKKPNHHLIEPASACALEDYQRVLASTRPNWSIA